MIQTLSWRAVRCLVLVVFAFALFYGSLDRRSRAAESNSPALRIAVTVDFGPDRGMNPGSLFEITDAGGRIVAGAGFLGAYNTQPRSDRWQLHCFLKSPDRPARWQIERLPAVESRNTGFYPFTLDGRFCVFGRGGPDSRVWAWDESDRRWSVAENLAPSMETVAGKHLSVTSQSVIYDGRTILRLPDGGPRIGNHYYAGGRLVLRQHDSAAQRPVNRMVVYPWQPEADPSIAPREEWTYEIPNPIEFIYAFGQWRDHILAVTNHGRVLRLDAQGWRVLREPVPGVSYQIYSAVNYYDRLLLGHYPRGEIYEYAGDQLKLLTGWPPVMPGVATSAREAQTLTIYGGDLYAGVWPWAEVWRYDRNHQAWDFVGRMFTHPATTDKFQHPYEAETKAVDKVANLWGQRVTGMEPLGRDLFITTSSKTGMSWEPRFGFLSAQSRADYGAVYRATIPGHQSVSIRWTPEPTRFEFTLREGAMTITQDGRTLGTLQVSNDFAQPLPAGRVAWGQGVFGPLQAQFANTVYSGN